MVSLWSREFEFSLSSVCGQGRWFSGVGSVRWLGLEARPKFKPTSPPVICITWANLNILTFQRFNFLSMCMCVLTRSCLTLCNLMDYSPSGFSVHGIFQVRILEWVAISSSRALISKIQIKPLMTLLQKGVYIRYSINVTTKSRTRPKQLSTYANITYSIQFTSIKLSNQYQVSKSFLCRKKKTAYICHI